MKKTFGLHGVYIYIYENISALEGIKDAVKSMNELGRIQNLENGVSFSIFLVFSANIWGLTSIYTSVVPQIEALH